MTSPPEAGRGSSGSRLAESFLQAPLEFVDVVYGSGVNAVEVGEVDAHEVAQADGPEKLREDIKRMELKIETDAMSFDKEQ